jgi:plastocyanin
MTKHAALIVAALLFAACGDGGPATVGNEGSAATTKAAASVPLTGNVIEVRMISEPGRGEIFEPADLTVRRGDVVRFVLASGVHNARFPAEKNPAGVELPPESPYMQLPGQKFEFTVTQPPGKYNYHCDPHVMLGMVGTMTVIE